VKCAKRLGSLAEKVDLDHGRPTYHTPPEIPWDRNIACVSAPLTERMGSFGMRTILLTTLVAMVAACSGNDSDGPPAQVAGNYTLTITDQQNGCNVENFTTNASQSGTVIAIAQDGSSLSMTAMSTQGLVLAFAAGDTLAGTIDGSQASLSSSSGLSQGGCQYSTTATTNAHFSDSQVTGTILYTQMGNGSSDCVVQQCTSTQTFTGSR
jgi:hypothetical protein